MKIYSVTRLSLFVSLFITALVFLVFLFNYLLNNFDVTFFISVPIFFIISYLTVRYVLKNYILNKIKPIYKSIQEPVKKKKKLIDDEINKSIIGSAKWEVENWTKKQIKELERLQHLEKYRKEFVGNVSHELKTPIFNIQGYVLTLLEGGIDDSSINKLYLKRTEKSINRMISIVEDLESITKLEAGELLLNFEVFDIVKMVEDVYELEHLHSRDNKISLGFTEKPGKPILIKADKKRIMEVLTNLVVNAIKYGKRRGFVRISFYDMDEIIMVEVEDNGIGIDANDLPRIFERFYRADKSRSRDLGGTGLGLSIVKHIIEAHGQSINVKSKLGKGTTFTFTVEKNK